MRLILMGAGEPLEIRQVTIFDNRRQGVVPIGKNIGFNLNFLAQRPFHRVPPTINLRRHVLDGDAPRKCQICIHINRLALRGCGAVAIAFPLPI